MSVPQLLLETLQGLLENEFEDLKWYLSNDVLSGCKPIPPSFLENASRVQTVSQIIKCYGEELAVNVTVDVLRKMNFNGPAEKLKSRYAAGKPATPASSSSSSSSSSSAAAPPAPPAPPAAMTAQNGSVIIAPNVVGGSSGAWNITINK